MKSIPENSTYVVCIKNDDYPASLEVRKIYPVIPDPEADEHQMIRVIDESGEDYLYPIGYFVYINLPPILVDKLSLNA